MSKLGDLTGSNAQEGKAIGKAINNIMGEGSYTKTEYTKIPLNEICMRYKNYYIDDVKKFKYIKSEIESIGLQQPIVVVEISKYKTEDEQENEYLKQQTERGCKYFISSGHRRFKAFVSLYLGSDKPVREDEINELYKNFGAPKYNEKYSEITCDIIKNINNEKEIYNATNLSNRGPSNFEYVISAIEDDKIDIEDRGYLKKIHDNIYNKHGNSISISIISDYVRIYTQFPDEWMSCILNGSLPLNVAQKILPIAKKVLTDENALNEVKNGTFRISKYAEKKKHKKAISFSKKDVLYYLYEIKRNPEKIDQVISNIEKLN